MPPLEAWEKVFVDSGKLGEDIHGIAGCVICHGGDSTSEEKEAAHEGIITDPSDGNCETCHEELAETDKDSLHSTFGGIQTVLEARGGNMSEGSPLAEAFNNHCYTCHTTCGQCHVSQPTALGGGLVSKHKFNETPSMKNNCAACHGARVGAEYLGDNEEIPGDLHWKEEGMTCRKCHGNELHGTGEPVADRYHSSQSSKCEDCHQDVWDNKADNLQHEQHISDLSCQVCHSVAYKSCYGCHVSLNEEGKPTFSSSPSTIDFKIGLNPVQSPERPYKYVVLRHPPTNPNIFDYYGENLLPDFDSVPTWKYATPHNIQLHTPQNESCNACHGNKDLFLTEDDVHPDEIEANKGVIVDSIPEPK